MKKYLLIIMDNEPSIIELTWCETVSQAKILADDWVYDNDYKYDQEKWLGSDDYLYRSVASNHNDNIGSQQFSIEITPSSKIVNSG